MLHRNKANKWSWCTHTGHCQWYLKNMKRQGLSASFLWSSLAVYFCIFNVKVHIGLWKQFIGKKKHTENLNKLPIFTTLMRKDSVLHKSWAVSVSYIKSDRDKGSNNDSCNDRGITNNSDKCIIICYKYVSNMYWWDNMIKKAKRKGELGRHWSQERLSESKCCELFKYTIRWSVLIFWQWTQINQCIDIVKGSWLSSSLYCRDTLHCCKLHLPRTKCLKYGYQRLSYSLTSCLSRIL